jgi:hypothetical protein
MLYVILIEVIKEQTLGITWIIRRYLSDQERLITLGELDKIFNLFANSIDRKILGQGGMRFEKSLKSYSNDQWLLCKEQTWFNMTNILYFLMLNQNIIDEMILIILRNRSLKG